MEMPANMRSLTPEAMDILRYYGAQQRTSALADEVAAGAGLSERGFGKAARRLVTAGFLTSDGSGIYRLTDAGTRGVAALLAAGDTAHATRAARPRLTIRAANRRLIVGVPRTLLPYQPTNVYLGFEAASDDDLLKDAANLLLRVSLLYATPERGEVTLLLGHHHAYQTFEIVPGEAEAVRVRIEVFQLSDFTGEYEDCGGMYIDLPIVNDAAARDGAFVAFGANVQIQGEALEG
jgi:hypothetical protein